MCHEDIQDIAKHQFPQPDMRWRTITEMFITYRLSLWNFWHFHNHNKSGPFCIHSFKSSFRSRQIEIMVCCYWKGQDWRNFCNQIVNTPISVSGCVIVWTLAITFDIHHIRLVKARSNFIGKHSAVFFHEKNYGEKSTSCFLKQKKPAKQWLRFNLNLFI